MENLEPILIQALKQLYQSKDPEKLEILLETIDLLGLTTLNDFKSSEASICGEIKLTKKEFVNMVSEIDQIINPSKHVKESPKEPPVEPKVKIKDPTPQTPTINTPQTVRTKEVRDYDTYVKPKTPPKESEEELKVEIKIDNSKDHKSEIKHEDSDDHDSQPSQAKIMKDKQTTETVKEPLIREQVVPKTVEITLKDIEQEKPKKISYIPRVKFSKSFDDDFTQALDQAIIDQDQGTLHKILKSIGFEQLNILLTDLLNHDSTFYYKFLQANNLFIDDEEYLKKIKVFTKLIQQKNFDKCNNDYIKKLYEVSPHAGMTLYLQHSQFQELRDPSMPSLSKQLIGIVNNLVNVPSYCSEKLTDILDMAEADDLDGAKDNLLGLELIDKEFYTHILPNFEQIFPGIVAENEAKALINRYKESVPENLKRNKQVIEFNEAFENKNMKTAASIFKNLILSDVTITLKLVNILKQYNFYDDIKVQLDLEDLMILNAPQSLVQDVKSLISGLKNPIDKESLSQSLESIAQEDAVFYEYFFKNFKDLIITSGIKITKATQDIIQDSVDYMKDVLPLTQTIFNIAHFLSLDPNLSLKNLEENTLMEFSKKESFDCDQLCNLLFFYIKKRMDIIDFINNAKRINPNFKMSRIRLIEYLLQHADNNLRTLIITSTSLYSATPLMSISIYQDSLNIWEDHFVVYEGHQSILSFKLPERGFKGPKGCSSLINLLMSRNFELHSESYSNFGTVEIQYDYNFSEQIHIPVADVHGFIENQELLKLADLFTMFVIHVRNYQKNKNSYDEIILRISKSKTTKIIVIIDHNSDAQTQVIEKNKIQSNCYVFSVKPIDKLDDTHYKILHEELHQAFFPDINQLRDQKKKYVSNPFERLTQVKKYIQFVESFNQNCKKSMKTTDLVEQFINFINENDQNLHSEQFLPFNSCFAEISDLNIKLNQLSGTDSEKYEQYLGQQKFLEDKIKSKDQGEIITYLQKILGSQVFLPAAMMIQKLLKGYIGKLIDDMNTERMQKRDLKENLSKQLSIKSADQDKEEVKESYQMKQIQDNQDNNNQINRDIEIITKEIRKIDEEIDKKTFSLEYVIRELYLLGYYKKISSPNYFYDFLDLTKEQISTGQPFEIIDGNNLNFISGIYEHMGSDITDKDVIVVSVVGPQSAGKSLLLNFLFGTQFQSAAGRCTKGVYASLIDVKIGGKKKKILILDTEGIQSAEARDDKFDKRIVFYIICVSHVVLICNKSDMNKEMSEVIRLAADCISSMNETKIKGASVYIIMNMVAEATNSALNECIQKLTTDLNTIKSQDSENNMRSSPFIFSTDNVMVLPWAFDKSQKSGKFKANVPSSDFIESLEPLRKKILDKCGYVEPQISVIKLSQWFKLADQSWTLAHKMKGLTEYKTLEDKRKERELSQRVVDLIKLEYEDKLIECYEQLDIIRNQILLEDKEKQLTLDQFIQSCKQEVDKMHLKKLQQSEKQFEQIISMMGVQSLKKNVESYFFERLEYYKQSWNKYQRQLIADIYNNRAYWIGDDRINQALKALRKEGKKYSKDEALEQFNNVWLKLEEEIKNKRSQETSKIKQNAYADISRTYRQFLPSTGIKFTEFEIESIKNYQDDNFSIQSLIEIQKLFKNTDARVFYFHQAINHSLEEIYKLQGQSREFIREIPFVYEIYSNTTVFYWGKMVKKYFSTDTLKTQLDLQFNTFWRFLFDANLHTLKDKLTDFIKIVNSEIEDYCVQITDLFLDEFFDALISQKVQGGAKRADQDMKVGKTIFYPALEKILKRFQSDMQKYFIYKESSKIAKQVQIQHNDSYAEDQSKYFHISTKELKTFQKDSINQPVIVINGQQVIKSFDTFMIKKTFLSSLFVKQNQEISFYFNKILETKSLSHFGESHIGKRALDSFFNMVDFEKVLRKLEHQVISKVKINAEVEEHESISYWVKQLSDVDSQERKQINKISDEAIKVSVKEVNIMITQLNSDLKPFGVQFSDYGIGFMYLAVMNMLIALAQQQYLMENNKPLEALKKMKQDQQNLFIAKLTSDDVATDDQIAKKVVNQSIDLVKKLAKKKVKADFKLNCEQNKSRFEKAKLVDDIENCALAYAAGDKDKKDFKEDQIINFFMDPKAFLEEHFKSKWENIIESNIDSYIKQFKEKVMDRIQRFRGFLTKMNNLFEKDSALSIEQFVKKDTHQKIKASYSNLNESIIQQPQSQDNNQNITDNEQAKTCASQYILMCLRNKFTNDAIFLVDGEEYVENTFSSNLPVIELNDDNKVDDDIIQTIEDILKSEGISKIHNFLNSCLAYLQDEEIQNIDLQKDYIISTNKNDLKAHFMGCEEYCPLCRRQCDKLHEDHENLAERVHECTFGHQILGFGGNKQQNNNFAITQTCGDFKSSDQVFFNNEKMDWETFKTQCSDKIWNFENKNENYIKEKNFKIWNAFGQRICKAYSSSKGDKQVNIRFRKANQNQSNVNHYIIMLDGSGSMAGKPWSDLVVAVKELIAAFENSNSNIKRNSVLSCIIYNSKARIAFENMQNFEIQASLIDKIEHTGGGTNFEAPLEQALDIMEKYKKDTGQFILCLMTDGEADYPKESIRTLKGEPWCHMSSFKAIFFAEKQSKENQVYIDGLQKIAKELSGSVETALDVEQLKNAFISLSPNLYKV